MTLQLDRLLERSHRRSMPARWAAYIRERFPPLAYALLIFSYYSSNQFLAHVLTQPDGPMRYDWSSLVGGLVVLSVFLQLRIFDDHKDFAEDCRHHPDRQLQQGLVSRRDLKFLLAVIFGYQLLACVWRGPGALAAVILVDAFSLLMLNEFFAREWLRRRFVLYASSHMLIVPLLALLVFSFSTGDYPWRAQAWYWQYALVGYCVAFNYEISRKIRAPEEEIVGVDSYTKRFGTYGAGYIVLAIRVVDTLLVALLAVHLWFSLWFYVWLIALFCVCLIGFLQFRFSTTPATAWRMQVYAGIYIVAFDLALAAELVRSHGLVLGN